MEYNLKSMPYAQCKVIVNQEHETYIFLRSYITDVMCIQIEQNEVLLYSTGTYSQTTARHINRFTREFFGENLYHTVKAATKDLGSIPGNWRLVLTDTTPGTRAKVIDTLLNYIR